jgi:nitrogen permease regulator 3-like protein
MVKREIVGVMHLRIRVVVSSELKRRVREGRERARRRRERRKAKIRARAGVHGSDGRKRRRSDVGLGEDDAADQDGESATWVSLSPKTARKQTRMRRVMSAESAQANSLRSTLSPVNSSDEEQENAEADDEDEGSDFEPEPPTYEDTFSPTSSEEEDENEDEVANGRMFEYDDDDEGDTSASGGVGVGNGDVSVNGSGGAGLGEDNLNPEIISDPSQATAQQRRWLAAMSVGKEPRVARRFAL